MNHYFHTMFRAYYLLSSIVFVIPAIARDITFPSISGFSSDQVTLGFTSGPEINYAKFAGLSTYANLPYVHCLAPEGEEVEKFDIAILGAPFDTVC
jgi:agmatinase